MVSRKSLDGERYLYEWRRLDTLTEFVVAGYLGAFEVARNSKRSIARNILHTLRLR